MSLSLISTRLIGNRSAYCCAKGTWSSCRNESVYYEDIRAEENLFEVGGNLIKITAEPNFIGQRIQFQVVPGFLQVENFRLDGDGEPKGASINF